MYSHLYQMTGTSLEAIRDWVKGYNVASNTTVKTEKFEFSCQQNGLPYAFKFAYVEATLFPDAKGDNTLVHVLAARNASGAKKWFNILANGVIESQYPL